MNTVSFSNIFVRDCFGIHILLLRTFPFVNVVTEFNVVKIKWIVFDCEYFDSSNCFRLLNFSWQFLSKFLM